MKGLGLGTNIKNERTGRMLQFLWIHYKALLLNVKKTSLGSNLDVIEIKFDGSDHRIRWLGKN